MDQKAYVICATHGDYDDFTRVPIFVCTTKMELELFLGALEKKEQPYWEKVVDFFANKYWGRPEDREYCIPDGLGFEWHEVDLLTLFDQHPAT